MNILKNKKNKLWISLAAAFFLTVSSGRNLNAPALAWWGTMYPQFCFAEKSVEDTEGREVKISFWLAKHLEWWYHK